MENKFKNTKIEYHILQTFPVTCLNRDDIGTPKSAIVGGVKRARVSSQCWKRQVRLMLHESGISIAVRTKHVADSILEYVEDKDNPQIIEAVKTIADALSDDTLIFFSQQEAKKIAEYIAANKIDPKDKNLITNLSKYLKAEAATRRKKLDKNFYFVIAFYLEFSVEFALIQKYSHTASEAIWLFRLILFHQYLYLF